MNNVAEGQKLEAQLSRLLELLALRDDRLLVEKWQKSAMETLISNTERYRSSVRRALQLGDEGDLKKAACQTSSMNKGVSDMGIFRRPGDDGLISFVSELSTFALHTCLAT